MENELIKVNTIPKLKDFLTELGTKQGNESALAHAITAQLQVLSVAQSPKLSSSPFDLMLESLKTAVQKTTNEQKKIEIQQKAAIMINSMIFFMDAKRYYEVDKWRKEGQDLLKEACGMVADTALTLVKFNLGGLTDASELAYNLYDNLIKNKGGLLNRAIDYFSKKERLIEYETQFYTFLESSFDKLIKYKNLFGNSLLLSQLVLRYKDELSLRAGDKSKKLYRLDSKNSVLINKAIGIRFFYRLVGIFFITLTVISGLAYLFYLFNLWGGDKWVENLSNTSMFLTVYNVHFGLLGSPLFIKIIIVLLGWLLPRLMWYCHDLFFNKVEVVKRNHIYEIKVEYYTVLAEKLDEF